MHKALHPIDDIDRLYASRKGGKMLVSVEDSVDTLIERLEDYIEKSGGLQLPETVQTTQVLKKKK